MSGKGATSLEKSFYGNLGWAGKYEKKMETWIDADPGCKMRYRICAKALEHHPSILEWLFLKSKPEMFASEPEVLRKAGAFSSGEQILVRVACTIWFNSEAANVFDICRRLDGSNFVAVMEAMVLFRKL